MRIFEQGFDTAGELRLLNPPGFDKVSVRRKSTAYSTYQLNPPGFDKVSAGFRYGGRTPPTQPGGSTYQLNLADLIDGPPLGFDKVSTGSTYQVSVRRKITAYSTYQPNPASFLSSRNFLFFPAARLGRGIDTCIPERHRDDVAVRVQV